MNLSQQVILVLVRIARGDLDLYDIMTSPKGDAQTEASSIVERMYDQKCEGWTGRGGVDDGYEEICEAVCDDLAKDYEDLL